LLINEKNGHVVKDKIKHANVLMAASRTAV